MAKFDAEDLLDMVLSIMTTNTALNTKIAAVEAEKTAAGNPLTPTLAAVTSDSYYVQTWSEKILNTSPAIFYGIENANALDGGGGVIAKTYQVFVEIVLVDNGMTNDGHRRINRYARALEELFAAQFAPAVGFGKVKIEQVRPISFKLELDSSDEIRIGGISLTITLV